MKKQYIAPASTLCTLQVEGMIAASLTIGNKPGSDMLSNEQSGWSSDNWNGEAADTEE